MKIFKFIPLVFLVFLTLGSCASKEMAMKQRKNFMMPQSNEVYRNKNYTEKKQMKTRKAAHKKKRRNKKIKNKKYRW